jgi:hypothetical protein
MSLAAVRDISFGRNQRYNVLFRAKNSEIEAENAPLWDVTNIQMVNATRIAVASKGALC